MKREILFRGRTIEGKEWVVGFLAVYSSTPFIGAPNSQGTTLWFAVDSETVGQFTGLTDKNGKKIFEGDIIRAKIEGGNHNGFAWPNMPVDFQQGAFCLNDRNGYIFCVLGAFAPSVTLEVIGNTHDNPELLEGGVDNG